MDKKEEKGKKNLQKKKFEPRSNHVAIQMVCFKVGGVVAVAHIGVLGHLMNYQMKTTEKYADRPQFPAINLPTGPYSSYKVEVGTDGYRIDYKSNDPKVLTTTKSSSVDKEYDEKGAFGKSSEGSVQSENFETYEYTLWMGRRIYQEVKYLRRESLDCRGPRMHKVGGRWRIDRRDGRC